MEEKLDCFIKKYPYIFLFGTGKMALPMKRYVEDCGITVQGMLVSLKTETVFDGTPVFMPDEIQRAPEDCGIVLALSSRYHEEVRGILTAKGFNHLFKCDDKQLQLYLKELNMVSLTRLQPYSAYMPRKQEMPSSWGHILIIRLDGIGDNVMMTPFLRELRRNHPESFITLLTSEVSYNLFEICPHVDEVIPIRTANFTQGYLENRLQNAKSFMETILHGRKVDVAMVPRWDIDYYGASFLSFFSGAKYSMAYSEKVLAAKGEANKNYDLLFSFVIEDCSMRHEVERNLDFLRAVGCSVENDALELWDNEEDKAVADDLLSEFAAMEGRRIIAVGLSAGLERKKWDHKRYLELILRISKEYDALFFVLLGGNDAYGVADEITHGFSGTNIVNLVGKLTLRQSFSLLKQAFMYVGNDTGIMHIAAAAGIRILEISSFPKDDYLYDCTTYRFRPWGVPCYIAQPETGRDDCRGLCQEPYAHCINDVSVDEVYSGFKELLNGI